jgi:hypothetical protein
VSAVASAPPLDRARMDRLVAEIAEMLKQEDKIEERWGKATSSSTRIYGDPDGTARAIQDVLRVAAELVPRLEKAAEELEALGREPGADPVDLQIAKGLVSALAFSVAVRRHRGGKLAPMLRGLEPALTNLDLFVFLRRDPRPADVTARMMRALSDLQQALDSVAKDPVRYDSRLYYLIHWAHHTVDLGCVDGPIPLTASGRAAVERFERHLEAEARGPSGALHGVAFGLVAFEVSRHGDRAAPVGLERARADLDRLFLAYPALKTGLGPIDRHVNGTLKEFAPRGAKRR